MQHILVVEDNPELRGLLVEVLEHEGYMVEAAENGAQALVKANANPPRLILLDLMMPVMDGLTFLRQRSENLLLAHIPVIVVSAASQQGLEDARALGAEVALVKPFDLRELFDLVHAHLPRQENHLTAGTSSSEPS